MADSDRSLSARCLCNNAAHTITIPAAALPLGAHICHCDSCRHTTGALYVLVAFLPSSYSPSQPQLAKLTPYVFSPRITYHNCATCGTPVIASYVAADDDDEPGQLSWFVPTGTLAQADATVFAVQGHEFIADTKDGGLSDFLSSINHRALERWPGNSQKGEQLPLRWRDPATAAILDAAPSDARLRVRCRCGGVECWIARPSVHAAEGTAAPLSGAVVPSHSSSAGRAAAEDDADAWWLRAHGTKYFAGVCACDSCRLACGMEWMQWAFIPTSSLSLDAAGEVPLRRSAPDGDGRRALQLFGTLQAYRSSAHATRWFCGRCSATVFWAGDDWPALIDVAVGLLDAGEGARAESWLEWRTDRLSYREDGVARAGDLTVALEEGLKAYGETRVKT